MAPYYTNSFNVHKIDYITQHTGSIIYMHVMINLKPAKNCKNIINK